MTSLICRFEKHPYPTTLSNPFTIISKTHLKTYQDMILFLIKITLKISILNINI